MRIRILRSCAFERCGEHPAHGEKWCYYHAKVMAAQLAPHPDSLKYGNVDRKTIEQVESKELKRLEDLLNGR